MSQRSRLDEPAGSSRGTDGPFVFSAFIEARLEAILARWMAAVQAGRGPELPFGPELADHIPTFLKDLARALREPGPGSPSLEEARAEGRKHGAQRFRPGFLLESVVREYGALLHAILDLVEEAGAEVSIRDLRSLNDLLSDAVAEAAAEFGRRFAQADSTSREVERVEARRSHGPVLAEARVAPRTAELERNHLPELFEQAPVAITVLRGPEHVIELANPRVCQIWGRPKTEIIDRPLFEALPEIAGQGLEELLHGVLTSGVPFAGKELPVRVARAEDGGLEEVYFDFVYQPMRAQDGAVEGILVVANDVTGNVRARRTAEEAVRAGEAERKKLTDLFMQAPVGICILDGPQHVFTFANPGYRELVGGVDVIGKSLFEAFPEVRDQGFDVLLDQVMASGEPFHGKEMPVTLKHRGEAGALILNIVYTPKRDAAGTIDGVMAFAFDVTELVHARGAAERGRAELQRRHEFEQHLAGIVGHDLRNPLQLILMSSALLLKMEELGERATRLSRRIHSAAERSARMIRDLLDFTQTRLGGGIPLVPRAADLYAVVSAALGEVEAAFPDRAIEVSRAGDTAGHWDADRLEQVVSNLLINALKYSPPGTPVSLRLAGGDGFVELSVHNLGPAIKPENLAAIFQPLRRGPEQVDRNTRSLGLGLFIVDSIVRAHAGTVAVVSTAQEGTTFTVRLPSLPPA